MINIEVMKLEPDTLYQSRKYEFHWWIHRCSTKFIKHVLHDIKIKDEMVSVDKVTTKGFLEKLPKIIEDWDYTYEQMQ